MAVAASSAAAAFEGDGLAHGDGVENVLGLWAESCGDSFLGELGPPVDDPGILSALEDQDQHARREGDKEAAKPNGKEHIQTSTKKSFFLRIRPRHPNGHFGAGIRLVYVPPVYVSGFR